MATDAASQSTADVQNVGLLFVHGIGEQKRWEHLRSSVVELAELLRAHCEDRASVSVLDRTEGWQGKPGQPTIDGDAPITVALRDQAAGGCAIDFECHEVWWADLGIRTGLFDSIGFWIWGLGQWAAPVYIHLDASRLPPEKMATTAAAAARSEPARPVVQMPRSVAMQLGYQLVARLNLAWAGIVAVLTVLSLSLLKRVAGFLGNVETSPTLLVQYIGDVQVYQQRAMPGKGLVSDPGHPKRVGIRRRMISEMVAMGARDYDRWYILAHSLGTVVAFNGIGEIGHTLPNYLPEALWRALPRHLRRDPDCALREDVENMMPARPVWLAYNDCIDRPALFAGLRGFITYGSPLDKFAALWPRIVAFETYGGTAGTDRKVFAQCDWINIVSKTDPVAGPIDRYDAAAEACGGKDLPRLRNVVRPDNQLVGLSHIQYWQVNERYVGGRLNDYYSAFFKWFTRPPAEKRTDKKQQQADGPPFGEDYAPKKSDMVVLVWQALCLTVLLWMTTTAIIAAILTQLAPDDWNIFGTVKGKDPGAMDYVCYFIRLLPGVAAAAALVVHIAGHLRWVRETWFNGRLGQHDRTMHAKRAKALEETGNGTSDARAKEVSEEERLQRFSRLVAAQLAAGATSLVIGIVAIIFIWRHRAPTMADPSHIGMCYLVLIPGLIGLAALAQSAINCLFGARHPPT